MDNKNDFSINSAIKILNEALLCDHEALKNLINCRVPCNDALSKHKSIQVGINKLNIPSISVLGLINGLFGVEPTTQCGYITMDCEGHPSSNGVYIIDKIIEFKVTDFTKYEPV